MIDKKHIMKEEIRSAAIMPLISVESHEDLEALCSINEELNLSIIEVTFRTEFCCKAIERLKNEFSSLLVGAGTVLTDEQMELALKSGADFMLSPSINKDLVEKSKERDIIFYPGCMTPSDLDLAYRLGLDTVKIFPAQNIGGVETIKAMSAPFPRFSFIATGGINNSNLKEYIMSDKIISAGGSWLFNGNRLRGNEDKIIRIIKEAQAIVNLVSK